MAVDGTIDRSVGSIASITGDGWLDGLLDVVAVAHTSIGSITGRAINNGSVDKAGNGSGICRGSYDANYGSIGQIIGEGAATDGAGFLQQVVAAELGAERGQAEALALVGDLGHHAERAEGGDGGQRLRQGGNLQTGEVADLATLDRGVEGEALQLKLAEQGICVSTGSACST